MSHHDTPSYVNNAYDREESEYEPESYSQSQISSNLDSPITPPKTMSDSIPIVFCILVFVYWAILWYKYIKINNAINRLDIQEFRSTLNEMKIFGIVMPLLYILTLGLCYSSIGKQHVVFSQVLMWLTILMIAFGIGIWWISSKIMNDCVEGICDYTFAKNITNYLYTLLGCGSIANFMAIVYFYFFNQMMKQHLQTYWTNFYYYINRLRGTQLPQNN
jgi:uncharacterized membrane protein YvlD (DUF360 family)